MKGNTNLLRLKIHEAGYTPLTLARASQICPSTLYNILSGKYVPSYYTIEVLTRKLKLSDKEHVQIFFPKLYDSQSD